MNEYDQQAADFLEVTGTTITKEFVKYDIYFQGEKEKRNIRSITLKNKRGSYTFSLGDSVFNSQNKYTVKEIENKYIGRDYKKILEVIQRGVMNVHNDLHFQHAKRISAYFSWTTHERFLEWLEPIAPSDYSVLACLYLVWEDNFEDRCDSFGYDTDSKKAEVIYHKCIEQDRMLRRLFDTKELELLSEIN